MTIFVLPFLRLLAVASAVNPRLSALQTRQSTCIIPDSDQEKTVRFVYTHEQTATNSSNTVGYELSQKKHRRRQWSLSRRHKPIRREQRLPQLLRSQSKMVLRTRSSLPRNAVPGQLHLHLCHIAERHRDQHLHVQPGPHHWRRRRRGCARGGFRPRRLVQLVQERRHDQGAHSAETEQQPSVLRLLDLPTILHNVSLIFPASSSQSTLQGLTAPIFFPGHAARPP